MKSLMELGGLGIYVIARCLKQYSDW